MNPATYKTEYPLSPIDCMYSPVPELYPSVSYCSSTSSGSSSPPSTPEPENKKVVKPNKVSTPKKQYRCTECLKYFSRPSALKTHSYTHTSEKPFQCTKPGCGRKFSVVSNLRRHFKVHQKPSEGNKLSSEDRLRYVRRLIRASEVILAQQKEAEEAQMSLDGRSNYNENYEEKNRGYSPITQLPQPSNYQYQHYFLVPSSNCHTNNNSYLGGPFMDLPYTWNNVEENTGVHQSNQHFSNHYISPASTRQGSAFYTNNNNNYRKE